jgi:hypothetical protein
MPYQWEPYPVTGETLRTAADDTEGRISSVRSVVSQTEQEHATALGAVDDQLEASVDDAPRGVITQANDTERMAIFAAGCLKYFAHAVDTFNTNGQSPRSVSTLNSDFEALIGSNFGVQRPDVPADATQGERQSLESGFDDDVAGARAAKEAEFDREYGRLEGNLDEAAADTQRMLSEGPTDANVKDLYSWGALPITAALIFPDVDFSHQYLPPEQAEALAQYVAERVEDGDINAGDVRLMGLYQANEHFAATFYRTVSPDEMTDAIMGLSADAFPYGSPSSPEMYEEQQKLYADFLVAAGTMLATYSKATGVNAPPSDFADTWGDAIVSEDPEDQYNAAALSLLFKHGQDGEFDSDFLADVTEIVYQYEQDHQGEGPIWGPRVGMDSSSGPYGPEDPTKSGDIWYGQHNYDPLANLFTAMNESPEAAEIFFSRGGDDDVTINDHDVQVNERLKYLLVDRIWPTDDGDGMGQLLEAATIGARNDEASGEQAAMLASQTMALIAENSGRGTSIIPGDDGWHLPEGARDSVGNILASYMSDVYRGAQSDGDSIADNNWVWGDDDGENKYGDVYGLRISHEDLGVVLQDVGRGDDKTGITTVVTAALNYNNELTSNYIAGLDLPEGQAPTIDYLRDHNMLDGLSDLAGNNGQSLSFIIDRGLVGGQDQEASDQEVRDAISTAFGAASEFVPTPQGKVAGFLTTEGLSFLQDKIGEQPDSASQAWAQDTDAAVKTSLQYQTYNALLQNGYLNASEDPAHGIPPECLVPDGNGNMVINPKLYNGESGDVPADVENAFNAWDSGRNPQGVVQDFINAYSSYLPSFR